MTELLTLHGINFADGSTEKLIVNRYGVMKIYNPSTSVWDNVASPTFNASAQIDSENFLDHAFFVNGTNDNYSYNDSDSWSSSTNLGDSPKAKYIKEQDVRLYLGNIVLRGTDYPSKVWYSNLPENNEITWDLETGTDLATTAASAVVTSSGSTFETNNIKVGDPFTIETGSDAGEYVVRSIDSETQITLTENLSSTDTSLNFWVGGNWFDVKTDDGDVITGFGQNSSELLIFKRLSLHRYNPRGGTLRQVRKTPGTGSNRSIVDFNEFTYYHDPTSSAIRRYDSGNGSLIISNHIEDLLENMADSMIDNVVGWITDGKKIEFYIGDTTTSEGDSIDNCVIIWDTITQTWSTRSLPFEIEQKTTWIQSGKPNSYLGTSNGKVLKVNDGYSYAGSSIPFEMVDRPIFPGGDDVIVDFQRIRIFVDNGHDLHVMFKLLYMPTRDNDSWKHSDWKSLKGRADVEKVEFIFRDDMPKKACGIQFKFIESSSRESFLIEKYIIYYSGLSIR